MKAINVASETDSRARLGKIVGGKVRHPAIIDNRFRLDRRTTANADTNTEPVVPATPLASPAHPAHRNAVKMDLNTKENNGRHLKQDGKILSQEGEISHHQREKRWWPGGNFIQRSAFFLELSETAL